MPGSLSVGGPTIYETFEAILTKMNMMIRIINVWMYAIMLVICIQCKRQG